MIFLYILFYIISHCDSVTLTDPLRVKLQDTYLFLHNCSLLLHTWGRFTLLGLKHMALSPTSLIDLATLLHTRKSIPPYQRDFVWDGDLITSFLEDIWGKYTDNEGKYFCGSIVMYKVEENSDGEISFQSPLYEIVDGQQRATVLYTLVAHLISTLDEKTDNRRFIGQEQSQFVFEAGGGFSPNQEQDNFRFTHRDMSIRQFYEDVGLGKTFTGTNDVTTKSLRSCQELVKNFVDHKFEQDVSIETMGNFYAYIKTNVQFTYFVADDIAEALAVYTRLNAGGRPLGLLEVLKGICFGISQRQSRDNWDTLEQLWGAFWLKYKTPIQIGGYGKFTDPVQESTLLSYYFLVNHAELVNEIARVSDGFLSPANCIKFILDKRVEEKVFENPEAFIKSISEFLDTLISFREGKYGEGECKELLTDIALISKNQTQPLILLMSASYNAKLLEAILREVRGLVFIFSLSLTGSGTTGGVWRSLAKSIRSLKNSNSESQLITAIKGEAKKRLDQYWETEFIPFVDKCSLETVTGRSNIKTILRMCEAAARFNAQAHEGIYFNYYHGRQGFDVDHLQPESLIDEYSERYHYVQKIGNAALLETEINRALGNTAFETEDKREGLKKSVVLTTRALIDDASDGHGYNRKVLDMFSSLDQINEESTENRQREILSVIKKSF